MTDIGELLSKFPQAELLSGPTPVKRLARLSEQLDIDLWMKRDDLTGLSFGGNKTRQLEFYIGAAVAEQADTILITGAVQSNFARSAAAAAAKHGMRTVVQREERVPGMGTDYYRSGNVALGDLLDVEVMSYPVGEDEAGADRALVDRAASLRADGHRPYIIPLGVDAPPKGALGYIKGAAELAAQFSEFDVAVVPSGSGATHGGFLTGLHLAGVTAPVHGICVRRDAAQQFARIDTVTAKLADLLGIARPFDSAEILVSDGALAPGYGQVSDAIRTALKRMMKSEGILLDPVYTAKTFLGLLQLVERGEIAKGSRVLMLHTGGTAALFAYQDLLSQN